MKICVFFFVILLSSITSRSQSRDEVENMKQAEAKEMLNNKIQELNKLNGEISLCEKQKSELKVGFQDQINELKKLLENTEMYIRLNGVYWTKVTLSETTWKDGKNIDEARTLNEWNKMTANGVPCYMRPEYGNSKEPGYLYNIYAVKKMEEIKGTDGLRLPTVEEGEGLVNYLKTASGNASNPGILLRVDSSLNVKEGGYCYSESSWEPTKTIFWLSPTDGTGVKGLSIGADNSLGVFERSSVNYGFMIRLVRK
jgi:hypothetical protein